MSVMLSELETSVDLRPLTDEEIGNVAGGMFGFIGMAGLTAGLIAVGSWCQDHPVGVVSGFSGRGMRLPEQE